MTKPIAIVDLDDTIFELGPSLCRSLNYHYGKSFTVQDFQSFDLNSLYEISNEQFFKAIISDYLLEDLSPQPGAVSSVNALAETHHIVLCTSRGYHPEAKFITRNSLRKHLISYDDLVIVENGQTKSQAYEKLGLPPAAVVFDDAIHNVVDLLEKTAAEAWMPMTPWNRGKVPEDLKTICRQNKCFRSCVEVYLHKFEGNIYY